MEVEWDDVGHRVKLDILRDGEPFLDCAEDLFVKTDVRADASRQYCLRVRDGTLARVAHDAIVRPIRAKVVVTRREGT
jgi:hypothetical protein